MEILRGRGFISKLSFVQKHSNHLPIPIPIPFHLSAARFSSPPKTLPSRSSNPQPRCRPIHNPTFSLDFLDPRLPDFLKIQLSSWKAKYSFDLSATNLPLMAVVSFPQSCFAAETGQISAKVNIESILVSIDDFFTRYPYFVASLAFVWLVVIPLIQEYLNKYKFISSIDAFRKLRDDPNAQLLDIRSKQSAAYLKSPSLMIYDKDTVRVEFVEGGEEEFVKVVLKSFQHPGNTILCVLDNFDGNSMKVAELLFKSGFKEAYAIKGGLRGKDGWQEIQEALLPPSVHVYKRKKSKSPDQADDRTKRNEEHCRNGQLLTPSSINQEIISNVENGYVKSRNSSSKAKSIHERPLSPYPNYTDLKPPSSSTPSKPQS